MTKDASGDPVVIVAARRTPIGRFLGSLADHTAVDLGEVAVRAVLEALPADERIDRVLLGCARQAGTGPNPARQVALRSGLDHGVVAQTINMACASGLEAVASAVRHLRTGEAEWIVAGGTESMSRVPFLADRIRTGYRMGNTELVDAMYRDGFVCPLAGQIMGETAETLAEQHRIPREEQDRYALESQRRAVAARAEGRLRAEIVPVPIRDRTKAGPAIGPVDGPWALEEDEHPREGTTLDGLARLRPVFHERGTVTAGNSSGITDGAAALLLTRRSTAERTGAPVVAEVRGFSTSGVDPKVMGIGPVPATRHLLETQEISLSEIDLVELNEAFAAQVLAVDRELGFDRERLNVHGGAIALGHPIGCSGARILVTLLHALQARNARRGLATLCVSGGMGMSMLVERPV